MASNGELVAAFRQKSAFMKSWKPASIPSNRDRLELYAWHKQAVSGDAPALQSDMTAAEKAKYTAWKSKAGTSPETAMRNYIQESERQVRVYGYATPVSPMNTPALEQHGSNGNSSSAPAQPSRGLAAIPLLCAAASEHRDAYLRRLQNTPMTSAWWHRQEPLTAAPGTIAAIPETVLLAVASFLEHISLAANNELAIFGVQYQLPVAMCAVLQSALWPLHNALLAVWMGVILIGACLTGALELGKTVLMGSRRTGRTLTSIWNDDVVFACSSVHTLTESHQPVSARVVGLLLQPLPLAVGLIRGVCQEHSLWMAILYTAFVIVTWWYWILVLPSVLVVAMLGTALLLGNCFGLIELASHI